MTPHFSPSILAHCKSDGGLDQTPGDHPILILHEF
jgi:hypothetical protein